MSEQELVSVIVPVYKAEMYLRRCIQSIQKQTYRNLEIILVDDGSPDKSPQICDRYAQKDKRIRVIHQKNAGRCSARNVGIQQSRGGCITFIDDDDWLPPKAIESLVQKMAESDADLVCGKYSQIRRIVGKRKTFIQKEKLLTRDDLREGIQDLSITPWAKLYRSERIKRFNLFFPTALGYAEDEYFTFQYLAYCRRVAMISDRVYYYSQILSASGMNVYHDDINMCRSTALQKRMDFFSEELPLGEQQFIAEDFHDTINHYISFLNREEAIEKIRETYRKYYADKLERITEEALACGNRKVKIYEEIIEELRDDKIEEVYDILKKRQTSVKRTVKGRLRQFEWRVLCPVYRFLVYRLNWFYHK